jgi:phage tail sheath protein FI
LERGAWIAPANEVCRGVVALEPRLDESRRLDLLLAQINQFTDEPEGFMALNADTLSLSQTPELRQINVRRLLILLRRAALRLGNTYVFEPGGQALRRLVQHAFESLLDQLFVRGAFAGATRATSYQVVTDDSVNTPQTADLGQFRVDLRVAPSLPMSFVTVRLVQTGNDGITMEIL